MIRQGKEAVEVWRSYFEKGLNEGGNSEGQGGGDVLGGESSWIDEGSMGLSRGKYNTVCLCVLYATGYSTESKALHRSYRHMITSSPF